MENICYIWILVVLNVNVSPVISEHVICNNTYQCVGNKIETTNGSYTHGNGYKSLYGSNTSVNGTGDYALAQCDGAFSCYDIAFIMESDEIWCRGSNSCSNINGSKYLYISGTGPTPHSHWIYCRGSNSCSYSNLAGSHHDQDTIAVQCYGDRSCAHAYFEGITYVNVYGAYGAYGAIFNSSGLTTDAYIYLYGYYAGYGGTILCYPETNCHIICHGNGCHMLYVQCSNNCIIETELDGTATPITNSSDLDISSINTLSYNSEILTTSNDAECTGRPNVFDNYQEKRGVDISINADNEGPICCRGVDSCSSVNTIIQFDTSSLDTTNFVVCSGYHSCSWSDIHNINGTVFCDGSFSCALSTITAKQVYCLALGSCSYAPFIYIAGNVYCSGYYGCEYSTITSTGNINIYLLGYESGKGLKIHCNENHTCFILCGGRNACSSTRFYCNGTCIAECETDSGCPPSLTVAPTKNPTINPTTNQPSTSPVTQEPSNIPSSIPTQPPSTTIPSIIPTQIPSTIPSMIPTQPPSNIPSFLTTIQPSDAPIISNSTSYRSWNPTNTPTSEISKTWIVKDDGNCHDGYTDLSESNDHYGEYCMLCPTNTAGTAGNCFECEISKEANHARTECVEKQEDAFYASAEFDAIISIIGLLTGCGCIGAFIFYCKKKMSQKNDKNTKEEKNIQQELQTLQINQ